MATFFNCTAPLVPGLSYYPQRLSPPHHSSPSLSAPPSSYSSSSSPSSLSSLTVFSLFPAVVSPTPSSVSSTPSSLSDEEDFAKDDGKTDAPESSPEPEVNPHEEAGKFSNFNISKTVSAKLISRGVKFLFPVQVYSIQFTLLIPLVSSIFCLPLNLPICL